MKQRNFFQRFVAMFLAFIFVLAEVPVVSAAGPKDKYDFKWDKTQFLSNDLMSRHEVTKHNKDEVLLMWDLPGNAGEEYELRYHLEDGIEYRFKISRNARNYVEAKFYAYRADMTTTPSSWQSDKTLLDEYNVFDNNSASFKPGVGDPTNVNTRADLTDLGNNDYLEFRAGENNGFSIKLANGNIFRFKWLVAGEATEKIQFSLDNATDNATYYDFTLYNPEGGQKTHHCLTGMSEDGLYSTPFDEFQVHKSGTPPDGPEYYPVPGSGVAAEQQYSMDKRGQYVLQLDEHALTNPSPGAKEKNAAGEEKYGTGVYLQAQKPNMWDEAQKKYVKDMHAGAKQEESIITIEVSRYARVTISDVYGKGSTGEPDVTGNAQANGGDPEYIKESEGDITTPDYVGVKLPNMIPSRMYDGSRVFYTVNSLDTKVNEYDARSTAVDNEKIHTFLKHEVVTFGPTSYYLAITPYAFYTKAPDDNDDYITSGGYYRLYTSDQKPDRTGTAPGDLDIKSVRDLQNAPKLYMPIDLALKGSRSNAKWFTIDYSTTPFKPNQAKHLLGQTIGYLPHINKTNLDTPRDLEIIESYVLADDGEENLVLRMKWTMGGKEIIETMIDTPNPVFKEMDYHFYRAESPFGHDYDANTQGGTLTYDKDEWLTVNVEADSTDNKVTKMKVATSDFYPPEGSGITPRASTNEVPNKGIVQEGEVYIEHHRYVENLEMAVCEVQVKIPIESKDVSPKGGTFFRYPGLYYITARVDYTRFDYGDDPANPSPTPKEEKYMSPESYPIPLTIDGVVDFPVPQPERFDGYTPAETKDNADLLSIQNAMIHWNKVGGQPLRDYRDFYLRPRGYDIARDGHDSVYFNLYISQSRKVFDDLVKENGKKDKDINIVKPEDIIMSEDIFEIGPVPLGANEERHYLRDDKKQDTIDKLRKGDLIMVKEIKQLYKNDDRDIMEVLLEGLDKNQTYYFMAETVIRPFNKGEIDEDGNILNDSNGEKFKPIAYDEDETEVSTLTHLLALTTKDDEEDPNEHNVSPRLPNIFDKKDVKDTEATVFWSYDPVLNKDEEEIFQYDVLRIKDYQLDDFKDEGLVQTGQFQKKPLDEVIENIKDYNSGWELGAFSTKGERASELEKVYGRDMSPGSYDYEFIRQESKYNIVDRELMPNQVYFYYVRAKKVVNGRETAYSNWKGLSLTTASIEAPTHLRVDRTKSYDKQKEAYINFDSGIDVIDEVDSGNYKFQYAIKPDGEDWLDPVDIKKSGLTKTDSPNTPGDYQYSYKITGLLPGQNYSIRVRTCMLIDGDWVYSSYSNEARTTTDQDSQEEQLQKEKEDWLNKLQKELEDLLKQDYWILEENIGIHDGLYRTSMFDGVMASNIGSSVAMGHHKGEGVRNSQTYYVPSGVIEKAMANDNGSFVITEGAMQVAIPSSVFDKNNPSMQKIYEEIQKREINDYYVKMEVDVSRYDAQVGGADTVSPKVDVKFATVGSKEKEVLFDKSIETKVIGILLEAINDDRYAKEIEAMLRSGKIPEDFVKYIDQVVEGKARDLQKAVQVKLKDNTKHDYPIEQLDGNYTISGKFEATSNVAAYQVVQGNWQSIQTAQMFGGHGIFVNKPGSFIFTARRIYIPGIENEPNGDIITQIVIKYNLDELYGQGAYMDLNAPMTNHMVVGTTARMLGASPNDDAYKFLNNQGIMATTRTGQQPISRQASVYYSLSMFEKRSGIPLNSMRITDYRTVAAMPNVESRYMTHMQVAWQMGIIRDPNFVPGSQIPLRDFMQMLVRLNGKVKLT